MTFTPYFKAFSLYKEQEKHHINCKLVDKKNV